MVRHGHSHLLLGDYGTVPWGMAAQALQIQAGKGHQAVTRIVIEANLLAQILNPRSRSQTLPRSLQGMNCRVTAVDNLTAIAIKATVCPRLPIRIGC